MGWKKRAVTVLALCAVVLATVTLWAAFTRDTTDPRDPKKTTERTKPQGAAQTTEPPPTTPAPTTTEPPTTLDLTGKKLVALTYDDGPHRVHTPKLLDICAAEDVKVTFFTCGYMIDEAPDVLQREAREGHQVSCHSYTHKNLTKLGPDGRKREIDDAIQVIQDVTGKRPTAYRPPYGAHNETVRNAIPVPVLMWSVDTLDWKYRNANTVYENVMRDTVDGSIVLMHDIHETTVEAAKRIIPALKAKGFTLVTVDQLLAARGGAAAGEVVFDRYPNVARPVETEPTAASAPGTTVIG